MITAIINFLKKLFGAMPTTPPAVPVFPEPVPVVPAPGPTGPRRINPEGLALVEYYEGLVLVAAPDAVGVPTIGLGRIKYDDGTPVKNGETCTKAQADEWLQTDLERDGGHYVRAWIQRPLNDNQYAALVSFTFNRGAGRLKQLIGMDGKIEDNLLSFDWAGSADNHLLGLQRRRRSECALFRGDKWETFKEWRP